MTTTTPTTAIYAAISRAIRLVAEAGGISKDKQTTGGQSFKYRSIDQVLNVMSTVLPEAGLLIIPRYTDPQFSERTSKGGGFINHVWIKAELDFVAMEDGSKLTFSGFGEAMDSGDKAMGKAMSYAYKNAIFQVFAVAVEGGTPDPDQHTHDIRGRHDQKSQNRVTNPPPKPTQNGYPKDTNGIYDLEAWEYDRHCDIKEAKTMKELGDVYRAIYQECSKPGGGEKMKAILTRLTVEKDGRKKELSNG